MRLIHKFCLLLLLASTALYALQSDQQQEIIIHADRAELNAKTHAVTYIGNVILTQGTIKITADKLLLVKQGDKLSLATATGTDKLATYQQQLEQQQGLTKAKAQRIVYRLKQNHIELLGKASLAQMGNLLKGERIVYHIDKQTAHAGKQNTAKNQQSQRVKVIIQPVKAQPTK